ncbi:hypothetical protein HTZ84_22230 [Haloterrigena sp. SYSU A558-1]|uniref:Uncharacterized protein n=1 Tax=Haloterrigena gelatinilytica TaxID=2741724 RepID=A0ABX2LK79_9EURY|nr:hypothetical protein [Haloterrigena gelatinilytica]NUC74985.1 hypothetical protein [Haloterrigena gelatinilytica]
MPAGEPNVEQNAGRCDICGSPIDMTAGDELVLSEYGIDDEDVRAEYDLDDQDAIDAVADALESVAESGAGRELASVIRETGTMRVHQSCLEETNYSLLETEVPA